MSPIQRLSSSMFSSLLPSSALSRSSRGFQPKVSSLIRPKDKTSFTILRHDPAFPTSCPCRSHSTLAKHRRRRKIKTRDPSQSLQQKPTIKDRLRHPSAVIRPKELERQEQVDTAFERMETRMKFVREGLKTAWLRGLRGPEANAVEDSASSPSAIKNRPPQRAPLQMDSNWWFWNILFAMTPAALIALYCELRAKPLMEQRKIEIEHSREVQQTLKGLHAKEARDDQSSKLESTSWLLVMEKINTQKNKLLEWLKDSDLVLLPWTILSSEGDDDKSVETGRREVGTDVPNESPESTSKSAIAPANKLHNMKKEGKMAMTDTEVSMSSIPSNDSNPEEQKRLEQKLQSLQLQLNSLEQELKKWDNQKERKVIHNKKEQEQKEQEQEQEPLARKKLSEMVSNIRGVSNMRLRVLEKIRLQRGKEQGQLNDENNVENDTPKGN